MSDEPSERSRIEQLERENAALRRANARLMRERLGSSNTAAAARVASPARPRPSRCGPVGALRRPLARLRLGLRRALLRILR